MHYKNTRSENAIARLTHLAPIVGQTVVVKGRFAEGTYSNLQLILPVTVWVAEGFHIVDRFSLPHLNVFKNSIKSCHFDAQGKFFAQAKVVEYYKSNGMLSYGIELLNTDQSYLEHLVLVRLMDKNLTGTTSVKSIINRVGPKHPAQANLITKLEKLEAEYYEILEELLELSDSNKQLQSYINTVLV